MRERNTLEVDTIPTEKKIYTAQGTLVRGVVLRIGPWSGKPKNVRVQGRDTVSLVGRLHYVEAIDPRPLNPQQNRSGRAYPDTFRVWTPQSLTTSVGAAPPDDPPISIQRTDSREIPGQNMHLQGWVNLAPLVASGMTIDDILSYDFGGCENVSFKVLLLCGTCGQKQKCWWKEKEDSRTANSPAPLSGCRWIG